MCGLREGTLPGVDLLSLWRLSGLPVDLAILFGPGFILIASLILNFVAISPIINSANTMPSDRRVSSFQYGTILKIKEAALQNATRCYLLMSVFRLLHNQGELHKESPMLIRKNQPSVSLFKMFIIIVILVLLQRYNPALVI